MLPITQIIGGAMQAQEGIYKYMKGVKQKKEAKKINDTRPAYLIPKEAGENVAMYQNLSNSDRMPGQAAMENRINTGMANDASAIRETGGSATNQLAAITAVNQNRSNSINDLEIAGSQQRMNAMDKLAAAKDNMANYRDQSFDYNENQEFQYRRMKKNMLLHASDANKAAYFEGKAEYGKSMSSSGGGMGGGMGGGQ